MGKSVINRAIYNYIHYFYKPLVEFRHELLLEVFTKSMLNVVEIVVEKK
jgi:bifunctional DNase/RNase